MGNSRSKKRSLTHQIMQKHFSCSWKSGFWPGRAFLNNENQALAGLGFFKSWKSGWAGLGFFKSWTGFLSRNLTSQKMTHVCNFTRDFQASGQTGLFEIMKKGFRAEPDFLKLRKSGFGPGHTFLNHENRGSISGVFFKTFKSPSHPYC